MIAPNVILIWPSTNASIPAGFTRETSLDGKFIKGTADATNPNDTGGSDTHTHTSSAHSHTMDSHSHSVTTSYVGNTVNDSDSDGSECVNGYHRHQNVPVAGLSGGGLSSVTSTYSSFSNNPPYYEVIFIKSTAYNFIPASVVALYAEVTATLPTGFSNCDGAGGTPNLGDKFLRGAAGGGDAGSTGGSTQNTHDLTHTHTESNHSHSQSIGGYTSAGGKRAASDGGNKVVLNHTHTYSLNNNTAGSITTVQLTPTEVVQPAYKKLEAIQNTSGAAILPPKGIIGLWLGTLATIPAGWFLCNGANGTPDMRGKYLKIAVNWGQIGDIGGSNTHTHASQSHSHTGASHSHTAAANTGNHTQPVMKNGVGGGHALMDSYNDTHTLDSIGSSTVSWASASTTGDESNNEPLYRTVAYIQFQYGVGGAVLFNML